MSRFHIGFEQTETAVHSSTVRRRAPLEEELLAAYAAGDAEMVSQLRERLASVEARGE